MDSDEDNALDLVEEIEREQELEEDANGDNDDEQVVEVQAENQDAENDESEDKKTVKPKRIIRNPQPKLNVETLKGPKGLTIMPELFKKQNFKGKGYEEHDLGILLKTYEYWCHRLYPKYPFEQCVEKLELLGTKRPVITYVKRIRMGLLDEIEEPQQPESDEEVDQNEVPPSAESQFDAIVSNTVKERSEEISLTDEQKERMRQNHERALKIRQDKLRGIQKQASSILQPSIQISAQSEEESTQIVHPEENSLINPVMDTTEHSEFPLVLAEKTRDINEEKDLTTNVEDHHQPDEMPLENILDEL